MTIYISTVSHGHSKLIKSLGCLKKLASKFRVVVKSNTPYDEFVDLNNIPNFHWIDEQFFCGFGHNNNIVFNYCRSVLGMKKDDYFIILNPDVVIDTEEIITLVERMDEQKLQLSAINLYKDRGLSEYDHSIRSFPTFILFVKSFLGLGNSAILDKSNIIGVREVDWAAGSFLAFKVSLYENLQGFDESYFMYCEDIDICYRSKKLGVPVSYHSDVKAIHLAKHANREVFSKHFYWHVCSVFRFLFSKMGLTTVRTSIPK